MVENLNVEVFYTTIVGINDAIKINFAIYPNPVKEMLSISLETEIKKAVIYNLQGQKVKEFNTKNVHIQNLSAGVYLVRVEDENGNIATRKFVKI